jgi:glycosyltransferase involved in cell wall biosynthesis
MPLQSNSMRILYIANIRMPTERAHGVQITKMCEACTVLGHSVTLVVPTRKTHIEDDAYEYYGIAEKFRIVRLFTPDTVSWGRLGFWFEQWWFSKMAFLYAIFSGADIIFSRDIAPLFLLSFVTKNLVWESHRGENNFMSKWLFRRAMRVVVISEGLKKFYTESGISGENIVVAHDGYDPNQFSAVVSKEYARARLELHVSKPIAMYIGSFEEWKGYRTFLDASKFAEAVLFVAIGGQQKQIKTLKLQYPNVVFLGEQPYKDLPINQQSADVLVIPNTLHDVMSSEFTSPLKVFAHMTSGVPLVVSDVPVLHEILSMDSVIFVEPDSAESLADGIKECIEDKEVSKKRAIQASKCVEKYTWSKRAETILRSIQHD